MRKILSVIVIAILFMSCENKKKESIPKKPNILFVLVDDLGYADLSVMGSKFYETPNIDKLANSGTIFTNGYAACTVCSPSRASLLNGQFTARHGLTQYDGAKTGQTWRALERHTKLLPPEFKHHLDPKDITLPEVLKENGYTTFFAGKWHLGGAADKSLPTNHGFDVNQGGYEKGGPSKGGYFSPFNNAYLTDSEEEKGMSLSMKLAKETSKFIKANKDSTFLAYLSFYAVHSPIQTTKAKWNKYRDKAEKMGIAEKGFEMERVLPARQYQDNPVYAGLIEQVDEAVGSVLKTLKEEGLDKNTIVVFTSDNGGVTSGDNYSTNQLGLRGGKGYQWEGGVRIPYFVYVPWMKQSGKQIDVPVSGVDLYPTLLDLANISQNPKHSIDGVSIKPLLEGNTIASRPLFWHYPHYGNQGGEPSSIIREGDWKLIYYWESDSVELYNLNNNLGETKDVSNENPEVTSSMKTKLLNWLEEMDTQYAEVDPSWDEAARKERLSNHKNKLMPRLEKQRKKMLSRDWQPNKDWWGSEVTETMKIEYIGNAAEQKGMHVWGSSPIKGKDGRIHLYASQWQMATQPDFSGWYKGCEIGHYVSDSPEGPFEYLGVAVPDKNDMFNSPHNPTISNIDGQYQLCFIVNENNDLKTQRIIMYVADNLNDSWRPAKGAESDGTILRQTKDTTVWNYTARFGVSNPSLIKHNGKYLLYHKSVVRKEPKGYVFVYGVVSADAIEGPYVHNPIRVTNPKMPLEDAYAFTMKDSVYLMSRDFSASLGNRGGGLLWQSADGLSFPSAKTKRAYEDLQHYVGEDYLKGAVTYRGKKDGHLERAQILFIDDKPAYLYLATGVQTKSGYGSSSHVFKISYE